MTYPYPPAPHPSPVIGYATADDRRDADHLRLLSIFHYVYGGLAIAAGAGFGLLYISLGVVFLQDPQGMAAASTPPPAAGGATTAPALVTPPPSAAMFETMAWAFIGFGSVALLIGLTLGVLTILSGRRMTRRRGRTFSLVVAGVNCLSVPFGTALGVFTFIVLMRDSVRHLYAREGGGANAG